jgi:hypothetical protein
MVPTLVRAAHTPARRAASDEQRRRSWDPLADRLARTALWAVLVVLLLREGADDVRTLRLRARRIAAAWWADVERRSRRDVRRSQIGLVAGRIGTRPNRKRRSP